MRLLCAVSALAALVLGTVPATAAVVQPSTVSCLAGKCHRDISAKRYIHGPIGSGSCEICHQVSQWQQGKHPSLLTDASGQKCLFCHEEVKSRTQMKHLHTPVAKGECTACHDPHQSNNRFMLIDGDNGALTRSADLCVTCHDGISDRKSSSFHAAVSLLDCSTCHDPHSSPVPYQLTHYVKTVYLRDHLAAGRDELQAGNYQAALDNLSLVLTVEPREITALTLAIESHLFLGEVDRARSLADRLIETNPMNGEAYYLKARVALAAGQDYQALSNLQQSLSLHPDDPATLLALGKLQFRQGMQTEALASLTRAVTADPANTEIHQALASLYEKLGRAADAREEQLILEKLGTPARP